MKNILLLILCLFVQSLDAGEIGLSLGYPYVSGKYNISKKISTELRLASGSGISVYSSRIYWNIKQYEKLNIFTGLEAGYINFNTLDLKGTGYETGLFLGGEYFISRKTSFIMDMYPVFIGLESDDYRISGIEWVFNTGICWYFYGFGKK